MTYATDATVRSQILENIEEALLSIQEPDYKTTLRTVRLWDGNITRTNLYPLAVIVPMGEEARDDRIGMVQHQMDLVIVLGVYDSAWSAALDALSADVRLALTKDAAAWTRGGLARTTQILAEKVYEASGTKPLAEAQISARVLYRTRYDDPTVPM